MKITVSRKELTETIKLEIKAVAVKPTTPILSGIYMKAVGGKLELQATDNEVRVLAKISANVAEEGAMVIAGKKFTEVIQKMTGELITITQVQGEPTAEISSGGSKFKLLVYNEEEYPKMKSEENAAKIKVRQDALKNLLKKTVYAATEKEDSRAIFKGILFRITKERMTLAATDAHRLATAYENLAGNELEGDVIIPAKILSEMGNFMKGKGTAEIEIGTNTAGFTFDNIMVRARIIEGQFPPIEKVFPKESTTVAVVNTKEMLQAVERVGVVSKDTDYNTINLTFGGEGIKIYADAASGSAEEVVEAEVKGGELDIGFNCKYVSDVLKIIDAEKMQLGLTEELKPAEIKAVGDDSFRYVVTPVRRR